MLSYFCFNREQVRRQVRYSTVQYFSDLYSNTIRLISIVLHSIALIVLRNTVVTVMVQQ